MARYALVDGENKTVNIIVLDDVDTYTPPEGLTLVPEESAPALELVIGVPEVTAIDFFNRFTDQEKVAVMATCATNPPLFVGLINGLASGSVTLNSEKMDSWLEALVSLKAITSDRRTEIQTF